MLLKRRRFNSIISIIVILSVMLSTIPTVSWAAETTDSSSNVTIDCEKISESEGYVSFNYSNADDDFSIYYNNTGNNDYYSETFDENGNLLYKVVQEGNILFCYDTNGNILAETTLSTADEKVESEQGSIAPLAYVWDDNLYWASGDTKIYNFSINLVVTIISGALTASMGLPGIILDKAINTLARQICDYAIPVIYYDGWKQYGWDTGFSIIRVNVDFYRYGHYNGFMQNYNKIIPNH